jgi:predicted LPLAT superfamily acyltransferase
MDARHWSKQKEETGSWRMALLFFLFRILPPLALRIFAYPVGFCYFLFSKKGRTESRRFLDRAGQHKNARPLSSLKHIISFALTVVEKIQAWGGRIPFKRIHFQDDDIAAFVKGLEQGKGAVLLCSHLGNMELLRALADYHRTGVSREIPVTSVVDFDVTPAFNRMLEKLNSRATMKIISVNALGPDTIIALKTETENGGLVVIAGDRTSANTLANWCLPFLGKDALFPRGPFLLAALQEVPVYAVFALRRSDLAPLPDYDMHVHKFSDETPNISRQERKAITETWARQFVTLLEGYCLQHPYQWYNFFDFWAQEEQTDGSPQD